jgi:hypothetical protein
MSYETLSQLPDPETAPVGPGFVSQQITDNTPGMIHTLNNGGSVGVKFSGSNWEIQVGYPQLTIAEANTIIPFVYSLQGPFTNFYVQLPTYVNPASGAWGATSIVAANVSSGTNSNQIDIANWANRGSGNELAVGDMIKLDTHNKIYLITGALVTAGVMTLTLNCDRAISSTEIGAATIEPNDIKFRVRLKGTPPAFNLTADGLYEGFTLSMRENII